MDDYDNLLAQVRSKPETAAPVDDYDSLLTQVRQDRHPQVQSALQLSSFKKPDQEAERANLVRDLKQHLGEDWSPVAVEPEEAKRRLKIAENDHVLQNSPRLAQKYLDTGFADRTFDDVKPLSEIESAIGKIGQAGAYVLGSSGSAMSRLASGFYGYLVEMPADMISTYATKPILGKSDPFGDISSWGAQNRKSLEDRANQIADVTGGGKDAGYLARMGYGALESVFQNLVTMPFAVESAAGKTFTAGKGAIASAMEAAQAIDLKSLLPMMISTAGQAYGKASDQGMSPAQAALFATLQGGAEGLTERIGLGALVRDVKMSAPLWKVLRNQLATENITEQAATHWQDFNEWAMLPENKDKTFGDYLSDRPGAALDTLIQTSIATVLQTSVMRASMRSMRNQMSESQIGQLQEQNLKDIIAAVSSSQTTQRTPQDVIDLIESVDGENATEVHINANIASEVLNQSQLATLVTPEQLEDAAMHGGDIVVPISQFAVAVAQDPSMQAIVEHARTDPDMPSGAETRLWEAADGEAFQKELEAVTAKHEADSEFQQSAKEVEDFVFNQMKSAGRHTESVNRSDALMHKAFASVMAERTGMKPMDFFKQHMLRVTGESVASGQQFNQTEYTPDDLLALFSGAPTINVEAKEAPGISRMSEEEANAAEFRFLSTRPAGETRYTRKSGLLKRVRRSSETIADELGGSAETPRSVQSTLAGFSAYEVEAEIIPPDEFYNPGGTLKVRIFGKEQLEAGLTEEPALTFTVTADGELSVNGPNPDGPTFKEFHARGWADYAQGAGGEIAQGWSVLRDPARPGEKLPFAQNLPLLADVHARVREWRGQDMVGLHWSRSTGAIGGMFSPLDDEHGSNAFFQSEKDGRDLVITHNLSADNLLHAVKMGGIPVPSLAVTKAAHPMVNFGDITLLGAKEMADPKGYAKTKVFGADIYSPRYPEVTFKLDSKAVNKLNAALEQYRDGREIYGGEIRKVEDLTQTAAFRKYMLEKTGKTDVWDLRSGDMDAEASRMLAEVGAEEKLFKGFDYNGNRRYVPHTLENVVKILKQELRGGENFNYGVGSLRAKFTPEFKSIEQIRKAKDRLMDKAGFEAVKEEVDHELVSIAESLDLSLDQTIEVMEDAPKMGVQRAIERAFDDYGKDVEITPEVKQQVAEYLTKLRNLPTEYFEAKILRDVDLAEFSGAVVPEGVDPKVIEALQARGIKDIRTYKKGDEADRAAKIGEFEHLFFQNKGGNRGSFNPDTNTIALLQNADLSTFLHESGHYFLEVIADVASQPNAPAQIKQDMDVLLGWFGVQATQELSASEVWSMMTLEEKRQYHEQFARGFESYLFEGKAPSLELQGIFSRFRRWLLDIYKSISSLDVQLTDEVRGVMDRMLATDEQIADAEAARRFAPIFQTQEESGMDDAQWAAYQAEPVDATDAAAADLQARSIRDMRWLSNAKSKKMAELQKASKALRDVVTMDVRREVMSQPIYMVWNFLSGKPEKAKAKPKKSADLDPTTDSLFVAIAKLGGLDRLEIVQTWGTDPEDIKKLPRQVFGKPIVRTNNGKSIDELAQRLSDYGYLATDEHGKVDVRDLEDLFAAEMRGDEQYSNQKDYAAAMQDREPGIFDLENFPHGKLDSASVQQFYGSDSSVPTILEGLKMLGQDGYLPDEVATEFGFSSGDDMMRQLAVAQSPNELIAQMVDQRMLSDHAELSSEQAIEAAAEAAIHNDVRSKFLTRELNALRKAVGKSSVLLKAARDFAAQKIASLKVRDAVKSNQHTAAEARSAREAGNAFKAGKLEEAATHKRDQVLNHELARASLSAKAEIAQIERWLKRFDNVTTRKAISYEYRDQIDALLEKFDLRQSVSDKELERRRSLSDWIASQEAMGLDPAIDDRLTRDLGKKHIRDLTLDELRGLKDSIANIEHLGRLKNQLLTAAKNRNLAAASAEIAASLNKYGKGRGLKDADIGDAHGLAALKQFGEGFAAEHRKLASIARQMDGDQDGGPMWEYFIRSMNAAGDKEATMRAEMSENLASLFDQIKGVKLGRKEQVMPGVSMTRENILMMALNWGNAGNRQRLMDGGLNNTVKTLTETQVNSIIGRLSKEEMDFVQGVWDLLEANRPAIAAQELRLTGVEPKWVEPTPVVTDHGTYRGGYFPAKYDGNFSSRSNELEAITDLRQQMQGAAGRAQTRRGYTQERAVEVVKRPLKLGFSVLTQHINEVTHRLAWQDWLIDTYRLLKRDEIEQAIRDHYGPVMLKQIKDTVKDIAAGDIGASSMMERGLNHMRTGATIAGLGWNLTTSFLQPLGLTQSVVRIGWGPVARGMKAFIAHPWKTIESVESRSAFMKNRAATINREINDVLNNVRNTHISRVEGSFFYTIQMMQKVADMPTWLGEYEKQIAAGNDDARAVAMADQAVIDAQGAGQMKDLAAIQRGVGPWGAAKKLFTNFYSYFNVTYNLAVERGRATDFKSPTAVGKLAADYLMLFTVPAILGALLKELVRGSDDDWDKEKILKKLAKEQLNYLMGTMVLTREIGAAITSDYGYSGPAGVRLFAEVNKLAKQAEQGEIDKALVKSAINVAGVAGLPVIGQFPAGQVNRTIDGIVAVSEGTAGPQAVIFGAPLKH